MNLPEEKYFVFSRLGSLRMSILCDKERIGCCSSQSKSDHQASFQLLDRECSLRD